MTMPKLPTFKEFKGNELAAVMFVLLLYFVYKEFTDDNCQDLREALKVERAEKAKIIEDKEKLTTALFVKNGVIDAILQTVDSTARVKLADKPIKE